MAGARQLETIRVDLGVWRGYQWRMPNVRSKGTVALAALLLLLPGAPCCRAETGDIVTPERPAEYMIYQYPGTALVLKIDAPEVEFMTRTLGPEQALIASSSVPGRRIGPVYQHLASVDRPRQLMIEVVPQRAIDR